MNPIARDYWEARGGWDEEFIEHGPERPACPNCGSPDCHWPEDDQPSCVSSVCLYCGADDCEGHSEAYVLAYLEEHPLGAPWEPGL